MIDLLTATDAQLHRLGSADSGPPQDGPAEDIPCPRCHRPMTRETGGSGVTTDRCGAHGVWFDRGELRAILEYVGVMPDSAAEPRGFSLAAWLRQLLE